MKPKFNIGQDVWTIFEPEAGYLQYPRKDCISECVLINESKSYLLTASNSNVEEKYLFEDKAEAIKVLKEYYLELYRFYQIGVSVILNAVKKLDEE